MTLLKPKILPESGGELYQRFSKVRPWNSTAFDRESAIKQRAKIEKAEGREDGN